MQKSPEIDRVHLNKLIMVFDQDLSCLGDRLGVELSCGSYKDIVSSQELDWKHNLGD
jgi:hypothetical protein